MSIFENEIRSVLTRRTLIKSAAALLGSTAFSGSGLDAFAQADESPHPASGARKLAMHARIKVAGGKFYLTGPANPEFAALIPAPDAKPLTPLLDLPLTDASIAVGANGVFYLTGSAISGDAVVFSRSITIWHSSDMRAWSKLRKVKLQGTKGRSPELHYMREVFWLTYSREGGGTDLIQFDTPELASSAFRTARITTRGEDPSLFADDDGKMYWVTGSGQIARLRQNPMEGLDEEPVQITVPPEITSTQKDPSTVVGTRGAFLAKIRGRYHLFAVDRSMRDGIGRAGTLNGAHDTYVASSESIYAGYGHRYIAFPYAGQTTLFRKPGGELWATFSGKDSTSVFSFRPGAFSVDVMDTPETPVFPGILVRPSRSFIYEGGPVGSLRPAKVLTNSEVPVAALRDTQVLAAPDGYYYMTGTTGRKLVKYGFGAEDYIPLWRSTDLETWNPVARLFELGSDKSKWYRGPTENPPELWAPEIHYIHETFWVVFCSTAQPVGNGMLRSITGRPEGPYEPAFAGNSALVQGDDPTLFQDRDGSVYLVWMNGRIRQLNDKMNGFVTEDRVLSTIDGHSVGYEGVSMARMGSWYVLAAAEWNGDTRYQGSYDLMYAVSKNIWGPYNKRRVGIPHAGHSSFFQDQTGRWYATMFGNDRTAPFRVSAGMIPLDVTETGEDLVIAPGWPLDNGTSPK